MLHVPQTHDEFVCCRSSLCRRLFWIGLGLQMASVHHWLRVGGHRRVQARGDQTLQRVWNVAGGLSACPIQPSPCFSCLCSLVFSPSLLFSPFSYPSLLFAHGRRRCNGEAGRAAAAPRGRGESEGQEHQRAELGVEHPHKEWSSTPAGTQSLLASCSPQT